MRIFKTGKVTAIQAIYFISNKIIDRYNFCEKISGNTPSSLELSAQ